MLKSTVLFLVSCSLALGFLIFSQLGIGTSVSGHSAVQPAAPTIHTVTINGRKDVTDPLTTTGDQGTSTLSKPNGDTITWVNNNDQDYYVCFSGTSPFEAFAWLIPKNGGSRSSGVAHDTTPDKGVPYIVDTSRSACLSRSSKSKGKGEGQGRGNPVVIIEP